MRKNVVLISGAAGEMGQALIERLTEDGVHNILALDISPIPETLRRRCQLALQLDIVDEKPFEWLNERFTIQRIFHLAAFLSTRAENMPEFAHRVNVEGSLNLLKLAVTQAREGGAPVKFIFPSSLAVYGLPDLETKAKEGAVQESQWLMPTTMYGCNKLYVEHLGRYYAEHYCQLAGNHPLRGVDFRAIRFPGLISAHTLPTGGTSDYGPEMLHAAARGDVYRCFVRKDTCMPFAVMPDAVRALLLLEAAPKQTLTSSVYNVAGFNPSAGEIFAEARRVFPDAQVNFQPDLQRQAIVDSWPADLDDSLARRDWGWKPDYDWRRAFDEYLAPHICKRYRTAPVPFPAPSSPTG